MTGAALELELELELYNCDECPVPCTGLGGEFPEWLCLGLNDLEWLAVCRVPSPKLLELISVGAVLELEGAVPGSILVEVKSGLGCLSEEAAELVSVYVMV